MFWILCKNLSHEPRFFANPDKQAAGEVDVPNIIVGGGNGRVKLGGQHILLPERTPIANLHLTLLQKAGIERDKFADSTGVIAGL